VTVTPVFEFYKIVNCIELQFRRGKQGADDGGRMSSHGPGDGMGMMGMRAADAADKAYNRFTKRGL